MFMGIMYPTEIHQQSKYTLFTLLHLQSIREQQQQQQKDYKHF